MFDLPPDAVGSEDRGGKKSQTVTKIQGQGKFCCEIIVRNECKALILLWTTSRTINPAYSWRVSTPQSL